MKRSEATHLRGVIEKSAQSLDDKTALTAVALHPAWASGTAYAVGYKVRFDGILYRCLTAHTAQADWTPTAAPSLWAKVLIPDPDAIPVWEQPDSTNPYKKGDKVTHNGATWVSNIDGNVWEPGVYGWDEIE